MFPGTIGFGLRTRVGSAGKTGFVIFGTGICGGFAAAYGTDELVTAFDRMSVQRPSTCGSEAVGRIKRGSESFDQRHLHTHFNQDGFGEDILVCYGIMSLWDMNRRTGATQVGRCRGCCFHTRRAFFARTVS